MTSLPAWVRTPPFLVAFCSALVLGGATVVNRFVHPVFDAEVYLPLHTLLELASVVVSFSIFAVYANLQRQTRDARGLFIGTGFLAVAILDVLHTLSFPGMPVFITPSSTEKGIYYWLAARLWASTVLLLALFIYPKNGSPVLKARWLLAFSLGLSAGVFVAVSYFSPHLPKMFVPGQGLTPLKMGLEYLVAALSLAAAILYLRAARETQDDLPGKIATALILTVFSELCFTLYAAAYDSFNLLGHLFKVLAYYYIFQGLFVAAVRRPYLVLERLKDEADDRLDRAIERLAQSTRAERVARERAEAAIEMLRPLRTVEEAALSNRNLDDLLSDLLERARRSLAADCATVFLLSNDGTSLRIRASVGLDQEARRQSWIPLGAGIAGVIAEKGEPMIVGDIDDFQLPNPGIRDQMQSFMGVPLKVGDRVIGVIHVGAAGLRRFGSSDLHLLELVGEGVASAVERARITGELEATVTSMASAVVVYNRFGDIVRMNPAAERVFGYSADERRQPISERMACLRAETPDGRPMAPDLTPPVRALRGEIVESELMVIHRRGKRVWLSSSAAPVKLAEGEVLGAVATFENVTAMRELEEQRAHHVLGISHGLRTPLTVIQGRAQILERMVSQEGQVGTSLEAVKAIVAQSRRMSLVLKDLVDLTHLESGRRLSLNQELVDVSLLAGQLLTRLAGTIDTSRIETDIAPGLPQIMADADRLERALTGLIANAVKYSPAGSPVTVKARHSGAEVVISVEDRGPGLPSEALPHLFDRSERARYVPPRRDTLGLGLYIIRGLVEAHGGRIWAELRLGGGTILNVAMPVAGSRES